MFQVGAMRPGQRVFARRGAYIGRVEAANDNWIEVREDAVPARHWFVPRSSVVATLPGGEVFLGCSQRDLEAAGWNRPPEDDRG